MKLQSFVIAQEAHVPHTHNQDYIYIPYAFMTSQHSEV